MIRLAGLLPWLAAVPLLAAQPPLLQALRWTRPDADHVRILTRAPAECLAGPTTTAVEIGRAAFRAPLLLGGQAARAGLSCESCHRSGRDNPDFHFTGISGAPGTADVTSSLFSKVRGDGTDNPRPIADLAAGPRQVPPADLRRFIEGQVVEEFDGAPPPPGVLDGLVAYVGALQPASCPPGEIAVDAATQLADARRAAAAGGAALAAGDPATAAFLLLAARSELGRLAERYPADREQAPILRSDAALAAITADIRAADPDAPAKLAAWDSATARLGQQLTAAEGRSLFNPDVLADRLARKPGTAAR